MACVTGSEVTTADNGELDRLTLESGCELEADIEDRVILVPEVRILGVMWEGLVDLLYVSGPVTVTEDVIGEVTAVSVMSDSVMLPMDEEMRAVSVMVGTNELCEEGIVDLRVTSVPEVAASEEMAVVDKVTVGWPFKEVRLGVLREEGRVALVTSCVVTALLVSKVNWEGKVGVTEVSGVLVAKIVVGEVTWDGEWVTELVTVARLGKEGWSVPVTAEVGERGWVDVGAVRVVRVVGVRVDSAVECSVCVMVGAEGTMFLCVVSAVLAEEDEEKEEAAG